MSQQFLIPCECGKQVAVTAARAGGSVPCECGKTVAVPTLRELKKRTPAKPTKPARRPSSWSPLQGGIFTVGGIVAAIALMVGLYYSVLLADVRTPEELAQFETQAFEELEKMDSDTTLRQHRWLKAVGIELEQPPLYIQSQQVRARLGGIAKSSFAIALAGLATLLSSFFLGSSAAPSRPMAARPSSG